MPPHRQAVNVAGYAVDQLSVQNSKTKIIMLY
jgi:hypothetical protein